MPPKRKIQFQDEENFSESLLGSSRSRKAKTKPKALKAAPKADCKAKKKKKKQELDFNVTLIPTSDSEWESEIEREEAKQDDEALKLCCKTRLLIQAEVERRRREQEVAEKQEPVAGPSKADDSDSEVAEKPQSPILQPQPVAEEEEDNFCLGLVNLDELKVMEEFHPDAENKELLFARHYERQYVLHEERALEDSITW